MAALQDVSAKDSAASVCVGLYLFSRTPFFIFCTRHAPLVGHHLTPGTCSSTASGRLDFLGGGLSRLSGASDQILHAKLASDAGHPLAVKLTPPCGNQANVSTPNPRV